MLYSEGGDYLTALNIGAMIDDRRLPTAVPKFQGCKSLPAYKVPCVCASACFFIWAAGHPRIGDRVMIHEPVPYDIETLSPEDQFLARIALQDHAREYMTKMRVPPKIIFEILRTPHDEPRVLTKQEMNMLRPDEATAEAWIKEGEEAKDQTKLEMEPTKEQPATPSVLPSGFLPLGAER